MRGLSMYQKRYAAADRKGRSKLLNEFCRQTGYHRKYAIALLRKPAETPDPGARPRRRGVSYSNASIRLLEHIWKAAGYPWSVRLKAMIPQWLPWARGHVRGATPEAEKQVLRMSARQMDRRLQEKKRRLKRRLYGRTKPGALLKHHIPVKTDCWDVHEPGFFEIDLVSHSGPNASGEFLYSLNLTDIHTGWCETCAVMGKGEHGVVAALEKIRKSLPFPLRAIDSDNGSEFINHHLYRYCQEQGIQFTRGRPYKKDDNAHIEQKNWTHVRKLVGWERYDTPDALDVLNGLYRGAWRDMMNFYQPCVKLKEKVHVGSRLTRRYDEARTPLDRLAAHYDGQRLPQSIQALLSARERMDPFALSRSVDERLARLARLSLGKTGEKEAVLAQCAPSPRGGGANPQPAQAFHYAG
jgi:hypothetical protein